MRLWGGGGTPKASCNSTWIYCTYPLEECQLERRIYSEGLWRARELQVVHDFESSQSQSTCLGWVDLEFRLGGGGRGRGGS